MENENTEQKKPITICKSYQNYMTIFETEICKKMCYVELNILFPTVKEITIWSDYTRTMQSNQRFTSHRVTLTNKRKRPMS